MSYNSVSRRALLLILLVAVTLGTASCGSQKIVFVYPDESLDFQLGSVKKPAMYIDTVTDMRPPSQREGQGHFFNITFPDDLSWEISPTQVYAEALAQDVGQTNLVELVPLHAQADYILSLDLLSMRCQLKRSPAAFLISGAIGAGLGMAVGEDGSDRAKKGAFLAALGMAAIPVPTNNHAEAEVRLTLKDRTGNIVWQESCLGEFEERKYLTATAREDQQLVNEHLTKAVKRANACLLGQLRQFLVEQGQ